MKRSIRLFILPAILLGTLPVQAEERPNYNAYFDSSLAPSLVPPARLRAADPSGAASAIDARRGVPSFLWAGKQHPLPPLDVALSPERAARWYVGAYAHRWN